MLAGTTLSGLIPIVSSKFNLCGEDEASMSFDVFTYLRYSMILNPL